MIDAPRRPMIVVTDFGEVIIPQAVAARLAPLTKGRVFDRRFKTARRDARYQRMLEREVERRFNAQFEERLALPFAERPKFKRVSVRAGA